MMKPKMNHIISTDQNYLTIHHELVVLVVDETKKKSFFFLIHLIHLIHLKREKDPQRMLFDK